jgi:hypothetical protein
MDGWLFLDTNQLNHLQNAIAKIIMNGCSTQIHFPAQSSPNWHWIFYEEKCLPSEVTQVCGILQTQISKLKVPAKIWTLLIPPPLTCYYKALKKSATGLVSSTDCVGQVDKKVFRVSLPKVIIAIAPWAEARQKLEYAECSFLMVSNWLHDW